MAGFEQTYEGLEDFIWEISSLAHVIRRCRLSWKKRGSWPLRKWVRQQQITSTHMDILLAHTIQFFKTSNI